jgi:biopolymer transport protein ExbB/TolQ
MDLYRMSFWQVFLAGGPLMWPILFCSIFAFAIIIEKLLYLYKIRIDNQQFLNNIL